jgi:putative membrane protein
MTKQSLWKGLVAGAVAGAAATLAKTIAEKYYPARTHGEPEPDEALAEKLAGHKLDRKTKAIASGAIHWGFGVAAGAAYGALAEYYPAASSRGGATFGLALLALTHETALPALGLEAPVEEQTAREHSSEAATHVVYGVVAERVRRLARRVLG